MTRTGGGGDVSRRGSARSTRDGTEIDITTRLCRKVLPMINISGEKSEGGAGADTFIVETKLNNHFNAFAAVKTLSINETCTIKVRLMYK